ncbi:MAG: hypothetical protein JXR67_09425 [Bacteroidales bacterium]|nr:hypothetical protein [Bacteroidales bacterium]
MNKFDDILRENVKKAFSNYNSDRLADEGWDSFVALQKGRRRRTFVIPLWARAASILLIIGLGTFLAYRLSVRQTTREIISATEPAAGKNEEQAVPVTSPPAVAPVAEIAAEISGTKGRIEKKSPYYQPAFTVDETSFNADRAARIDDRIHETLQNRSVNPDILPVPAMTMAFSEFYTSSVPDEIRSEKSRSAVTASEGSEALEESPVTENSSGGRRLLAGLSGSMARAGEESSPVSGMSMGFYLSQKITRRLSVRPGLALAMQSFGLENSGSPEGISYNIPLYDGTNGIPYSYEGRLSMMAVELPLNLVFTLVERKRSGFFISAGTSSLFYISQQLKADVVNTYTKMDLNTATGQYTTATMFSRVEVEKEYDSFSRADFFGLANLSAGYSFPYSKTGIMLVEPFVQLPVNDLTSLNLRIRYAGVSMKLQFGKNHTSRLTPISPPANYNNR